MQLIKSPLNYTGNKYRIMDQIIKYFPENIECMIDLFCGGATLGLNTNAKKVIFVDSNERIINLLIFLSKQDFDGFIKECENVIDKYGLSYSFKYGYKFYREKCNDANGNDAQVNAWSRLFGQLDIRFKTDMR